MEKYNRYSEHWILGESGSISSVGPSLFIRGRRGGAAQPHGRVGVLKMRLRCVRLEYVV
jgi:hypothetical protein